MDYLQTAVSAACNKSSQRNREKETRWVVNTCMDYLETAVFAAGDRVDKGDKIFW